MPQTTVSVFGSITSKVGSPGSTSPLRPATTWFSSGVTNMLWTGWWTATLRMTLCVAMSITSTTAGSDCRPAA